jgi:hypothetical protein
MNRMLSHCVASLLVLSGAPAMAMYRCGNVFQDKPCESGPEVRLSPSGGPARQQPAAPAAPAAPPVAGGQAFAAACSRIGEHAQRIVWKREGGATQEQQLAERASNLPAGEHARTVASVYSRRGSAPEIRSAIEAECIVDKQKEADAAELLTRMRQQAGEPAAASREPAAPAAAASRPESAPMAGSGKPSAAACASLKKSLDNVRARMAQGGSSRQMESLQNDRRSAEASLRSSGCS